MIVEKYRAEQTGNKGGNDTHTIILYNNHYYT